MDSSFLASEFPDTGPENAGFHIIPVPLERTVSYGAGTCRGPAAILEASQQLEAWDGISSPGILGFHTCEPVNCDQPIDAVFADIMAKVHTALEHGAIPVTLGGEHTVSYAPIRALHDAGREFGILHFDAHADLRNISEGDAFSHACVLRRVVEDCGLPLVQFGTRDYSEEEADFRKKAGITAYDAAFLARKGLPRKPLPKRFPKNVYVTFDVDGLDSSLMPATGTPEPDGLSYRDILDFVAEVLKSHRLVGLDVVELCPMQGNRAPDFLAARLIYQILSMKYQSEK